MNLSLVLAEKRQVAEGIYTFALTLPDGSALPPHTAGAHIQVKTPAGVMRHYSLCNAPRERNRYVIAVKREADGGGGSISMTDRLVVGDHVDVSEPENFFPLAADAGEHLLLAGGIGITPMFAMAQQLHEIGVPFRLIYCARSPEVAAFADVLLQSEFADRVTLHFDGGDPAKAFDVISVLATRGADAHAYCCGPRPFMAAVREATRHWPHDAVHFEDFGTSDFAPTDADGAFRVRLARSGRVINVPAGVSILEALRREGVPVPSSCEAGTCGSCRTGLIAGEADHRDFVLDDDEMETSIMICVSRSKSAELTIDV